MYASKAQFFRVTFTLSRENMLIQSQLNRTAATLTLELQKCTISPV